MCNEAGVKLLAGTDTFGPGSLLPGVSLHNELRLLCRAGLSPLQVLQSATVTAASALAREADFGVLEEGNVADLLVLEADPLAATANLRQPRLVMKAGKVYDPKTSSRWPSKRQSRTDSRGRLPAETSGPRPSCVRRT